MRLIMIEIFIMNFGGFLFNPHYLHTLMHDVIKTHHEPQKFIMSISIIMSLIMTLLVFQCIPWLQSRAQISCWRRGYFFQLFLAYFSHRRAIFREIFFARTNISLRLRRGKFDFKAHFAGF